MPRHPDSQPALGDVIRERRMELGQTQEEVALAAGTDQARISRIEDGENPSFDLARRVVAALGWSLAELESRLHQFEREDRRATNTPLARRD